MLIGMKENDDDDENTNCRFSEVTVEVKGISMMPSASAVDRAITSE